MSDETNLSTNVNPNALPSYLQNYQGDTGREGLEKDIRFPSLFAVRENSKMVREHGAQPGEVYETVNKSVVLPVGGKFHITPIFHYREFTLMEDRDTKLEDNNPVRERTLDPDHWIAKMATAAKMEDRYLLDEKQKDKKKKNGSPYMLRAIEARVYLCYLPFKDQELPDLNFPVVRLSFDKGEYRTGQNLGMLINGRSNQAPMHACIFEATTGLHRAAKDDTIPPWYGFNIKNPAKEVPRWLDAEQFASADKFRELVKTNFSERLAASLHATDEESDEAPAGASDVAM